MEDRKVKLRIKNVKKRYENGDGVEDISFDVYEGEFITMLGPSGCGKSTILRTLGGFLAIDEGEILVDGNAIDKLPPEKRPTAMVFQSYNLWPHMSVFENLAFGLRIKKIPQNQMKKQVIDMLQLVGMNGMEKKYPGQLSGGQQQRVAIARALLLQPAVLLLDEPFSALDAKIRSQMREELKKIQQKLNITIVFVTHDQEEAMALSHRIVVMNKGHIEQIGSPTEIYDEPQSKYVASFIGEMNLIEEKDQVIAVRPENVTLIKGQDHGEMNGVVESSMVLGHFVVVGIQVGSKTIKTYLNRSTAKQFSISEQVSLSFDKKCIYSAS